jgi:hypothetical protein
MPALEAILRVLRTRRKGLCACRNLTRREDGAKHQHSDRMNCAHLCVHVVGLLMFLAFLIARRNIQKPPGDRKALGGFLLVFVGITAQT